MALTDKLTNIANAIREKGGTTEKLTLDAMPNAIAAIETGGGGEDKVPEVITITRGDCKFYNDDLKFLRENYADRIECQLQDADHMFYNSTKTVEEGIGFTLNMDNSKSYINGTYMFASCDYAPTDEELGNLIFLDTSGMFSSNTYTGRLPSIHYSPNKHSMSHATAYMFGNCLASEIGTIYNFQPYQNPANFFKGANRLRHCPEFENFMNDRLVSASAYFQISCAFEGCYSLRTVPNSFISKWVAGKQTGATYHPFGSMFKNCYSLDEVRGLMPTGTATLTMDVFLNTFDNCCRLKHLSFALQEDGTPYTVKWKNQTVDLSQYVGWAGSANSDRNILDYNSGITAEDEDNDWSNNPNYWSRQFVNSRFNHDSAVNLINSLPDTSAYLATQSGATNTIKFKTNAGSATPGGGVNALTEEEIAVATAKGWTISYTA